MRSSFLTSAAYIFCGLTNQVLAQPSACKPTTDGEKVVVCSKALTFNRCTKTIKVDFSIDTYIPNTPYEYTYDVFIDGRKESTTKSSLGLTGLIPPEGISFPVKSNGDYYVEIKAVDINGQTGSVKSRMLTVNYKPKLHAIVVGIAHYQHSSNGEIRDLHYADKDALSFKQLLEELWPADRLDLAFLTNGEATFTAIADALAQKAGKSTCCGDDLFVFYYSGHGFIDNDTASRYLGTYNIDPGQLQTGIDYFQLVATISEMRPSVKKLIILDSCFSGAYRSNSEREPAYAPKDGKVQFIQDGKIAGIPRPAEVTSEESNDERTLLSRKPNLSFFSAAEEDVPAEEGIVASQNRDSDRHFYFLSEDNIKDRSKGHGLYTYFLLTALSAQMSDTHRFKHTDLVNDGVNRHHHRAQCILDFDQANREAMGDIDKLRNAIAGNQIVHGPLQTPTEYGTQSRIGPIRCQYSDFGLTSDKNSR